jgi:hypothetical protein
MSEQVVRCELLVVLFLRLVALFLRLVALFLRLVALFLQLDVLFLRLADRCVQKDDVLVVRCDRLQILLHEILAFRPFQILALKQIDEDCPLGRPQSLLT